MKAVNLFAGFCLTIFLGGATSLNVFAQQTETVKSPSEINSQKNERTTVNNSSAATTNTVAQNDAKRNDERYRIGYNDTIEVSFNRYTNFNGTYNVGQDGAILMPRLKEPIIAVCKTEVDLAKEISVKYLTVFKDPPFVNVRVVSQQSQSAAVIGAVGKPGNFFLTRRVRLLELLSFAGGPDTEKAGTKLIVARTGSSSVCKEQYSNEGSNGENVAQDLVYYQFKIRDVLEGKENLWIQPGDIVSVLDFDLVYVYGNVDKQGSIKLRQPITLRQAIAEAGGFKEASKKDKIRVLRQKNGGTDWDELIFNLKEIDTGKVKDPLLLPNDIVAVSEDPTKSILNSLKKSVTGGLPSLFYRIP